jgi:hypothetical protein
MLYKDDEIGITTYIIDREGNTRASNHIGAFKNGKIYVGKQPKIKRRIKNAAF